MEAGAGLEMCIPAAHSCNWCFPGCRVRTGLLLRRLQPHLSVIRISALNLHCGVGREGFSEPLGQGWVPEWEQDWEHGHSLSLVALAAPLAEGETEARAALATGMGVGNQSQVP